MIAEREFDYDNLSTSFSQFTTIISNRDWFKFCDQPDVAAIPVVMEFYANVVNYVNHDVKVRGRKLSFSSREINKFYGHKDIEDDDYAKIVQEPDYDLIIRSLCKPISLNGFELKMGN
uniref:Putative plant transposon protein domain-containing protein n=1 Tax=Cannabis sativa TaxID=3483 RepID=A0A803Q0J0_CANSA